MSFILSYKTDLAVEARAGGLRFLRFKASGPPEELFTISNYNIVNLVILLETAGAWFGSAPKEQEGKNSEERQTKVLGDMKVEKSEEKVYLKIENCKSTIELSGAIEVLNLLKVLSPMLLKTICYQGSHLQHINNFLYLQLIVKTEEELQDWLKQINAFPREPGLEEELFATINSSFELLNVQEACTEDISAIACHITNNAPIILLSRKLYTKYVAGKHAKVK